MVVKVDKVQVDKVAVQPAVLLVKIVQQMEQQIPAVVQVVEDTQQAVLEQVVLES